MKSPPPRNNLSLKMELVHRLRPIPVLNYSLTCPTDQLVRFFIQGIEVKCYSKIGPNNTKQVSKPKNRRPWQDEACMNMKESLLLYSSPSKIYSSNSHFKNVLELLMKIYYGLNLCH